MVSGNCYLLHQLANFVMAFVKRIVFIAVIMESRGDEDAADGQHHLQPSGAAEGSNPRPENSSGTVSV